MKRGIQHLAMVVFLALSVPCAVNAQTSVSRDSGCKECHECEIPTKLNPCLKKCPRGQMVTVHHSADASPAEVILDKVEGGPDVYEPVTFAHRAHAKMAEMSGGCAQCHHYNLSGSVLACRSCHATATVSKNSDLSKPTLKGAYHRQCVNCHRESGVDTKCDGACHRVKSEAGKPFSVIHNEVHVAKPDRIVVESSNEQAKFVTFFHNDHADRFGIACATCHKNESCSSCHKNDPGAGKPVEHIEGGHDRCSACHSVTEKCEQCHDKQPRERFDHARQTSFDLGRFHSNLACTRCHKSPADFKGLNPVCTSCHKEWKPGAFAHAVTGIKLSETHAALDCESCHLESNFAKKPACNACHDDKSYPTAVPGTRVERGKPAKPKN